MHTINIRKIEDKVFDSIKEESSRKGLSINKFLLKVIDDFFNRNKAVKYHDLDDFFGTWSETEHNQIKQSSREARKIDKELWQ